MRSEFQLPISFALLLPFRFHFQADFNTSAFKLKRAPQGVGIPAWGWCWPSRAAAPARRRVFRGGRDACACPLIVEGPVRAYQSDASDEIAVARDRLQSVLIRAPTTAQLRQTSSSGACRASCAALRDPGDREDFAMAGRVTCGARTRGPSRDDVQRADGAASRDERHEKKAPIESRGERDIRIEVVGRRTDVGEITARGSARRRENRPLHRTYDLGSWVATTLACCTPRCRSGTPSVFRQEPSPTTAHGARRATAPRALEGQGTSTERAMMFEEAL